MFDERKKEKEKKEKKMADSRINIPSGDNGRVANIACWTIDAACFGQIL